MSDNNPHEDRKHTARRRKSPEKRPLADMLERGVDLGLLGILFLAPLVFGGRHEMGRFVFVALSTIVGLMWFARQIADREGKWTPTRAHYLWLVVIGLLILQVVPLPTSWIRMLSPRTYELLPLWDAGAGHTAQVGTWRTLSLAPAETRASLAVWIGLWLLFVTATQRLRNLDDVERLLRWIALAAVSMAGFGLLQYFTSDGKFLWIYEYPNRAADDIVKGPFTNRNHFAHFLVLGFAPLVAWFIRFGAAKSPVRRSSQRFGWSGFQQPKLGDHSWWNSSTMLGLALTLVLFSMILSLSRGGVLVGALALGTFLVVLYVRGQARAKYVYGILCLGIVVIGLLSVYGYDRAALRLNTLAAGSLDAVDRHHGRRKIWLANIEAARGGPLMGAGAGSHRFIYPVYFAESQVKRYSHAENGYLQIATETGLPGVVLTVAGVGFCAVWLLTACRRLRSVQGVWCLAAVTAGIVASLAHSLIDFVWYIPACLSVTVLLLAALLRLAQLSTDHPPLDPSLWRVPLNRWIGMAAAALLLGIWATLSTAGPAMASVHWDRYHITSLACEDTTIRQLLGQTAEGQSRTEDAVRSMTIAMVDDLEKVVRLSPDNGRAHLSLAGRYLDGFTIIQRTAENAMSVTQIRDAAWASKFDSPAELRDWLEVAFPESVSLLYQAHQHALRAMELIPLEGQGYLYLADLCFLHGGDAVMTEELIQQALVVRPYSGDVLFEVGKQRLVVGRIDEALKCWQVSYQDTGVHQVQIVQLLAGRLPATQFVEVFHPDWKTFGHVWNRYRQFGQPEDLVSLLEYADEMTAALAVRDPLNNTAWNWLSLARMHVEADQLEAAADAFEEAYTIDPTNYSVRSELANVLLRLRRFSAAEEHLRWCRSRRPEVEWLRIALEAARKGMLQQQGGMDVSARKSTRSAR